MADLSISTLIPIISIGSIVSLIIYILYLNYYKSHDKNIILYIIGKTIQSSSWILLIILKKSLNPLNMTIAVSTLFIGLAIEVYTMIRLNGIKLKQLRLRLIIFTIASIIFYSIFSHNLIARVLINSLFISILFFYLFIWFILKKEHSKMQKIIGWTSLLFAIVNASRGLYSAFSGYEIPIFTDIPLQIITGITWIVVSFSFPLLFLFTLKENDNYKLQQLNLTKDKFFRIIGHDLKGPIGSMIQFSQLIEDEYYQLSDENKIRFINSIKESSIRSFKLLENLLEWACSQTDCIAFKPEPFINSELVFENIQLFEKQAISKNIKINTVNIYEGSIVADRNMINTVIRNLLSNAIKYTYPNGSITLSNKLTHNTIKFSVQDTGIGISADDCNKIFKINFAHTTEGTNKETGTGIGLILCKEFIDRHKGKIWVNNKVNIGSIFHFSIPLEYK